MKSEIAQKLVWANEQIKNGALDYNDDFCVLNDIGCGKLTEDSLKIIKNSKRNGYHAKINGNYKDPDRVSIILYMLYVKKYQKSIKDYGVTEFCIAKRDSKSFCISVTLKNGSIIELASDWVLSWNRIVEFKKDQFEIVEKTHTIIGHPLWPCRMVKRHNTINQARNKNRCQISMKKTLDVLGQCYENNFTDNIYEDEQDRMIRNLKRAFCDNKEWFLIFETGNTGFNNYVDFWDLKRFVGAEISQDNVMEVFS